MTEKNNTAKCGRTIILQRLERTNNFYESVRGPVSFIKRKNNAIHSQNKAAKIHIFHGNPYSSGDIGATLELEIGTYAFPVQAPYCCRPPAGLLTILRGCRFTEAH